MEKPGSQSEEGPLEEIDRDGRTSPAHELLPVVYDQLRELAARYLSRERPGHTMQPTSLVHEAFLRIGGDARFADPAEFYAIAGAQIRRVLVDHARRHRAARRGSGRPQMAIEEGLIADDRQGVIEVLAVDDALGKLERLHGRPAKVAEMRFFGGMKEPDVARVLGLSRKTIAKDWQFAKAFLSRELTEGSSDDQRSRPADP